MDNKKIDYIVFTIKEKEVMRYTALETFPGELKATRELLAYEHKVPLEDVLATLKKE